MRTKTPQPLSLPWELRPNLTARTEIDRLVAGRRRSWVDEVLNPITPEMLAWWFAHLGGDMELATRRLPRYRVWRPLDHVYAAYIRRTADGSIGPVAQIANLEYLGRNPRCKVQVVATVERLDTDMFVHTVDADGLYLGRMEHVFEPVADRARFGHFLIVPGRPVPHLSKVAVPVFWPQGKRQAWLQHATAIAAAFGPGAISPTQVVFATGGRPLSARDLQAIAQVDAQLARDPRVRSVRSLPSMLGGPDAAAAALAAARTNPALAAQLSPVINAANGATLTVMAVTPRTASDTTQASKLVTSLRRDLRPALRGTGMQALVGDATAAITDVTNEINAKTPLVLALIIIVALLLLGAVFRSPLVALAGLAGTLLSVAAAYGLLHCVFQAGHTADIVGYHATGAIESFLPLMLFAILVGLSTDYQVFLISRVKEEWEHSHDAAHAIAAGLARSGPVILSAALRLLGNRAWTRLGRWTNRLSAGRRARTRPSATQTAGLPI